MMRQPEPELMDVPERAAAYAQADFRDVNAAFVTRLVALVGDRPPGLMLDVGTGPGDIARLAADALLGWRVVGIDASSAMLKLARTTAHEQVYFILADAKRTPFADCAFDFVYASSILHHVADPFAFWRELRRVCAAGGLILVRDLYRPNSEFEAKQIVETYAAEESPILQEDFYNSLLAAYTLNEIREQLTFVGLPNFEVQAMTDRHVDAWGKIGCS